MVDTRPRDLTLDFQDGTKLSPSVDLRNKGNNYSVEVFKTMQGVHACKGLFDIVLPAYCLGIFVLGVCFVLYNFPFA